MKADEIQKYRALIGPNELLDRMVQSNSNVSKYPARKKEQNERTQTSDAPEAPYENPLHVYSETPFYIHGALRDYQLEGLNFLIRMNCLKINCILADEMGLGKTLQTLSFLGYLRFVLHIKKPSLLIVPKSTLRNWENEAAKFLPKLRVKVFYCSRIERKRLRDQLLRDVSRKRVDILLTTYEMCLSNDLLKFDFLYLVIDEGHRIKNEKSKLSLMVRKLKCDFRLLITGTPLNNNVRELWALLNFLAPEIFRDAEIFENWINQGEQAVNEGTSAQNDEQKVEEKNDGSNTENNGDSSQGNASAESDEQIIDKISVDSEPGKGSHRSRVVNQRIESSELSEVEGSGIESSKVSNSEHSKQASKNSTDQNESPKKTAGVNSESQLAQKSRPSLQGGRKSRFILSDDSDVDNEMFESTLTVKNPPDLILAVSRRKVSEISDDPVIAEKNTPTETQIGLSPGKTVVTAPGSEIQTDSLSEAVNGIQAEPLKNDLAPNHSLNNGTKNTNLSDTNGIHDDPLTHDLALDHSSDNGTKNIISSDSNEIQAEPLTHGLALDNSLNNGTKNIISSDSNEIRDEPLKNDIALNNSLGIGTKNITSSDSNGIQNGLYKNGLISNNSPSNGTKNTSSSDSIEKNEPEENLSSNSDEVQTNVIAQATSHHIETMRNIILPFFLRREKREVEKTLKPKRIINLYPPLSQMQQQWYAAILRKEISHEITTSSFAVNNLVVQLRKVCNHPYLFPGAEKEPFEIGEHLIYNSGKLHLLDLLLKDLYQKKSRVLVFTQWTSMLDIIDDYCTYRGFKYLRLDGNTTYEDRNSGIELFNKDDSIFLYLLTTRAGGLGINLTAADTVIIYDCDWNPQMDLQAMDRAHRIGQKKEVVVYKLICDNTIEEKILIRCMHKLKLDERLLKKSELRKDDLLDIIADDLANLGSKNAKNDFSLDEILQSGEKRTKELIENMESATVNTKSIDLYKWNEEEYKSKVLKIEEFIDLNEVRKQQKMNSGKHDFQFWDTQEGFLITKNEFDAFLEACEHCGKNKDDVIQYLLKKKNLIDVGVITVDVNDSIFVRGEQVQILTHNQYTEKSQPQNYSSDSEDSNETHQETANCITAGINHNSTIEELPRTLHDNGPSISKYHTTKEFIETSALIRQDRVDGDNVPESLNHSQEHSPEVPVKIQKKYICQNSSSTLANNSFQNDPLATTHILASQNGANGKISDKSSEAVAFNTKKIKSSPPISTLIENGLHPSLNKIGSDLKVPQKIAQVSKNDPKDIISQQDSETILLQMIQLTMADPTINLFKILKEIRFNPIAYITIFNRLKYFNNEQMGRYYDIFWDNRDKIKGIDHSISKIQKRDAFLLRASKFQKIFEDLFDICKNAVNNETTQSECRNGDISPNDRPILEESEKNEGAETECEKICEMREDENDSQTSIDPKTKPGDLPRSNSIHKKGNAGECDPQMSMDAVGKSPHSPVSNTTVKEGNIDEYDPQVSVDAVDKSIQSAESATLNKTARVPMDTAASSDSKKIEKITSDPTETGAKISASSKLTADNILITVDLYKDEAELQNLAKNRQMYFVNSHKSKYFRETVDLLLLILFYREFKEHELEKVIKSHILKVEWLQYDLFILTRTGADLLKRINLLVDSFIKNLGVNDNSDSETLYDSSD